MDRRPLTLDEAREVYNILVEEGAWPDPLPRQRADFISGITRPEFIEYRFIGMLGFGGKFWDSHGKWFVSCYPEDRTPERDAMIVAANVRLEQLRERFRGTLN
jgi:hypothetical protein